MEVVYFIPEIHFGPEIYPILKAPVFCNTQNPGKPWSLHMATSAAAPGKGDFFFQIQFFFVLIISYIRILFGGGGRFFSPLYLNFFLNPPLNAKRYDKII